jgi:OFA family oxalate/formate antiporter-like MFS transporter
MGLRGPVEVRQAPASRRPSVLAKPGLQLAAGVVAMVAIANLQYGWTFFVGPLHRAFGWGPAAIQVAFTLFVLAETWLVPVEGYLVDRFGPRPMVAAGGLLVGSAWVLNAAADWLPLLYLGNALAGVGAGIVYGASIGSALKWFPRRRGLAAGVTAAAFGAGSALTVLPIIHVIEADGYRAAFLWFGLGQGAVVVLCALVLRLPPGVVPARPGHAPAPQRERDCRWPEVVRAPVFWLMYAMMTLVTTGGLMTVAQLEPIARHYGVADAPLSLLGYTFTALVLASALDRVLNGLTRPLFGWISDHVGRENTMFLAFALEGAALLLLLGFAGDPLLFVVLTGLTFFAWGEIYSLFPALCADLFGRRFATTNYGLLYTAKGTAALLVPLGSVLAAVCGSWEPVFLAAAAFNWLTAALALVALKPLARRWREATADRA